MKRLGVIVLSCFIFFVASTMVFAGGQKEEKAESVKEVTITLWTTEEQPERMEIQRDIAVRFKEKTGISVDVVPVSENVMGERVTAAFSAGELPDVIYHPLNFTLSWAEAGILDSATATDVVEGLGEGTFGAGALDLVKVGNEYAAVPVDGWTQLLVYRADLFKEKGLQPPTTYSAISKAIDTLHNPPGLYGFVAATDPSQVYFMQVFEHVALANGVDIVDDNGNVTVNTPQMIETLKFYKKLAQASPPGNLYWQQSRELYFAGKTAMIIWSPFIMDELAGLRDSVPVTAYDDPTTRELAKRTGFITNLAGPGNPKGSGWTDVRYFGITVDANVDASRKFVEFSMNEGYLDTLAIAPEGKFPVRKGTTDNPVKFIEGWKKLPVGVDRKAPSGEIYSDAVIEELLKGLETGSRWGFKKGYGSLTSKLYDTRIFAELVRQYIDGERSVEETARIMQREAEALMK